jgi:hypothetical protein
MTIPTLSPTPVRGDPDTFSTAFETFLTGLDPWAVAVQAVGDAADADATAAAASAATATIQVGLATAQAVLAEASADAAAGSALVAGAVAWVSGTTYAIGDCRYSPINLQTYRRRTDGAGTIDPSADSTNWAKAIEAGISNVVTATGSTTLTSTPTLLQITPASYGIAVTLPDATTCTVGGPLHIIDNRGAYPVRVLNSAGTLLGFIFAGVVSHVSLIDNSTAAGVWTIGNSERVGQVAQLTAATNLLTVDQCVDIGSGRELLMGRGALPYYLYAVVYDKANNGFGPVTLVRAANFVGNTNCFKAISAGIDKVLVISCPSGSTAFEAVVLSTSGTNIAVGTVATATLSANISTFADGCGLIAVGSSFVCSYTVATPAAQIRALSISGTTVTIGSATVLAGSVYGLIQASGSIVIAMSATNGANVVYAPYTVSGSTLSAGTAATVTTTCNSSIAAKFAPLGTRWFSNFYGATNTNGVIVSLSGTVVTVSTVVVFTVSGGMADAIIVGSNKVLMLEAQGTNNANILTDTAGTASAGTAITLSSQTTRACLYVSGTDVFVQDGTTTYLVHKVDCSGASPVLADVLIAGRSTTEIAAFVASNSVLSRSPKALYGADYARNVLRSALTQNSDPEIRLGKFSQRQHLDYPGDDSGVGAAYRGTSASSMWVTTSNVNKTAIVKLECVA